HLSERAIDERGAEPWFRAIPIQRAYTRRILTAVGSMCNRSLACHDVGCGIGQCLAELQHRGFHVLYGCDVEETYIGISRWVLRELHVPACLTVRNGCDYVAGLAPSEAGMVLMLNWTYRLELSGFLQLLKNAKSALDPDGVLFVDVMRRDWPAQMGMEQGVWYQNYPLNWSGNEAQAAFASLGFRVLSCWGRFSFARQVYALTVSR
ncbi:MAG TPA: class I SAM-dependent methyltransferase, partial [Terriglobia bacterium]|nr:class I SAM-dependent methyltransferase [Terriglobia bacterium]